MSTTQETSEEDPSVPKKTKTTTFSLEPDPLNVSNSRTAFASDRHQSLETVKTGKINSVAKRKLIEENNQQLVVFPWNRRYKSWWSLTVFCAVVTVFTETYAVAFSPASSYLSGNPLSIIEYVLVAIFVIDIFVAFHLVYYDSDDHLIMDKKQIAFHYLKGTFGLDLAGVFPLYLCALVATGELGSDSEAASFLSLLRLVKLVRLYRVAQLFEQLQYNPHVSLMWLTLLRNFGFAILWSHFSACLFFFIAREYGFDADNSWIGSAVDDLDASERYVTSLYWSVVT